MERDWSGVQRGTLCRVCDAYDGPGTRIEMAHVIPRRFDEVVGKGFRGVDQRAVVPLCIAHHRAYDASLLDLLPHLSHMEQAFAVERVGLVTALCFWIN